MFNRRDKGNEAEKSACQYLQNHGLTLIERNYSTRFGEIDIIMKDSDTVVFIEVRYRRAGNPVSGLDSVNHSKARKIVRTAQLYLQDKRVGQNTPARIDVVSVSEDNGHPTFEWVKNAISAH